MDVLTDLRNRCVRDVFFIVCDGLTGLPDSVNAVFPQANVQASSMHHGRWRDGPAGHRRHRGQDLCRRVTNEVHTQTRPAAVVAGF